MADHNKFGAVFDGVDAIKGLFALAVGQGIGVCLGSAVFKGGRGLRGASVHACDLRAGAALIIAACAAEGVTYMDEIEYVERGYEDVVQKFTALGANIEKITE